MISFASFRAPLDHVLVTVQGQLDGLDRATFDPLEEQSSTQTDAEREKQWERQRNEVRAMLERFEREIRAALGR